MTDLRQEPLESITVRRWDVDGNLIFEETIDPRRKAQELVEITRRVDEHFARLGDPR